MKLKINCKHNDNGAWCTNKNVKRSLFGLGARVCCEHNGIKCDLIEIKTKRAINPPKPNKR